MQNIISYFFLWIMGYNVTWTDDIHLFANIGFFCLKNLILFNCLGKNWRELPCPFRHGSKGRSDKSEHSQRSDCAVATSHTNLNVSKESNLSPIVIMTNQKCFPHSTIFRPADLSFTDWVRSHLAFVLCRPVFSQCNEHLTSPCWPLTQEVTVMW